MRWMCPMCPLGCVRTHQTGHTGHMADTPSEACRSGRFVMSVSRQGLGAGTRANFSSVSCLEMSLSRQHG